MNSIVVGIDISKETFDAAVLINNKVQTRKFNNSSEGFNKLVTWLKSRGSGHVCMEATGIYWKNLAKYLYDYGYKVSVVNPARIKGFAMSKLSRTKTDKADSVLIIADFCKAMKPEVWYPQPIYIQELQQLVNHLNVLIKHKTQETNRLEGASKAIANNIQMHIKFLETQIKEIEQLINDHIKNNKDLHNKAMLLESIPGIGAKTQAIVLAFLADIEKFSSAKQVVAFVGLNPKHRQSGSSVRGASRISRTGNSDLRKSFYMPAMSALRHNCIIKHFSQRLSNTGKPKMLILTAAMRKLLHIIYGVLKHNSPFNLNVSIQQK
ncbi:transposase and inactivated derivative [Orientia tsutsugamushi str. Boryong]|uniref:Transposase and inactivated derivative n=3 Tax=Orientia tsutsugamushi TaxID=784 RepID=A5CBX8_ORITB|nr:transposase and inactivated derivative [Orientia tsutsugamushi str. Boryong]